ncbi:MAG: Periplasmic pH-dependent serine endoprotease DegQ [Steroidobacteraceae bacterium]|nr:Periplasmic pH-dependent serine endoprotease DegQ [Steroidobacteraceae bacterium]
MSHFRPALCALVVVAVAFSFPAVPAAAQSAALPTLAPIVRRASPAVVNIATRGTIKQRGPQNPLLDDPFFRRFFDVPPGGTRERQFQSAGSGVIVDAKNGYVLTNAHVIENASEITVTLEDGTDLKAEVVGSDTPSDIAVLKVKHDGLVPLAFGDSSRLEVGDYVVAIGNPFGLQHTVTQGIVSGLSRSGITDGYEDFIQTDASINPGNSGGALVNLRGELIGINTAILSRSGGNIGIGFAIPANMAKNVMEQLVKYGTVKRGLLGVSVYTVTPDIAQSLGLKDAVGALVSEVVQGSPADKAGLRAGDVITTINNQNVRSNTDLQNTIGLLRVGDRVDVGYLRDGKPRHATATIAETPVDASARNGEDDGEAAPDIHRGLVGAQLVDAPNAGGVLVRAVDAGSPAAQAGLRPNDVIVNANRTQVGSLRHLREAARGAQSLVLTVRRGSTALLIPLR